MVLEHPNSGELELSLCQDPVLATPKSLLVYLATTFLLVLRGVGSGQPTNNNKHLEQQFGFGAAACRHAAVFVKWNMILWTMDQRTEK
jgi:hypothetical protein